MQDTQPPAAAKGNGDAPLPLCLVNKLSRRARRFFQDAGLTCQAFLDLTWEDASRYDNVGQKTWKELEALKDEIRGALEKADPSEGAPEAGGMFRLDRRSFAGFDDYLAAFLRFYPPVRGSDIIFEHRLGIIGKAKPEPFELTRRRFEPALTRERIRQITDNITGRWFNDHSRCLVSDLLADATAILEARGGAMPAAEFAAALEEASGWKHTPVPARLVRFLRLFKALDYYPKLQAAAVRDFGKSGRTAGLAARFKAFCADKRRAFSEIDYANFKAAAPEATYQAYQILALNLLLGDDLPLDKKQQLKAFATMGRLSFNDVGDARPAACKILEVLRKMCRPVTPQEWLRKARAMFPDEDFTLVQVRRIAHSGEEVVHFDRGKFIWHECVSLPPGAAAEAEKHFTTHLARHDIDACSIYNYYTARQFSLASAGVPSQTLFYFLLKSACSGALEFPEYPKVARPGGDGGPGAFDRIIMRRFGADAGVSNNDFERFYSEALCSDPRQAKWHLVKFRRGCAGRKGGATPPGNAPSPSAQADVHARAGELADAALTESGLVYCNRFHEIHGDELRGLPADGLRAALQAARPGLCFTGEAFAREPGLQPRDEIRRVLSAAPGGMTLHALLVQLPYLPPMVVEETLVGDPDFTRGKPGRATKWSLARAVAITPEDCEALRAELDTRLKNAEWVPAAGFDLSAIAARNPGVPAETLRARLLREALGMEYQVRRGVITRKGLALRPRQAIAALCRARETLTRDDLNEMAQQIYGRRSVPCLDVPGGRMVRVTADLFVAERLVPFDTPGTDAALEALCPGDYIPACAVRDFSTFPAVNYPWTHALLESYCRRHSRVFSFATFGWNIQSVGVILRKSSPLKKYRDILADALARSGLRFSDAAAAHQYLKQEGYVLNRMPLLLPKIFSAEK